MLLLSAVVVGFPPLFLAMLFSHVFPRLSVLVRTLLSSLLPAIIWLPIAYLAASGGAAEERLADTLTSFGIFFLIGLPVAYLKARRHPVLDQEGNQRSNE